MDTPFLCRGFVLVILVNGKHHARASTNRDIDINEIFLLHVDRLTSTATFSQANKSQEANFVPLSRTNKKLLSSLQATSARSDKSKKTHKKEEK